MSDAYEAKKSFIDLSKNHKLRQRGWKPGDEQKAIGLIIGWCHVCGQSPVSSSDLCPGPSAKP